MRALWGVCVCVCAHTRMHVSTSQKKGKKILGVFFVVVMRKVNIIVELIAKNKYVSSVQALKVYQMNNIFSFSSFDSLNLLIFSKASVHKIC